MSDIENIKRKRIADLEREKFRSDQEEDEMKRLEEELNLIEKDTKESNDFVVDKPKRRKRTVIEVLREKLGKKPEAPATNDEIDQLKRERTKAILKRDIALAKSEEKALRPKRLAWLGSNQTNNETSTKKKKSKKRSINVKDEFNISDVIGKNDKKDFSALGIE